MRKSWIVPPSEAVRRLAIEQVQMGDAPEDVAAAMGVSERSIWRWLARWKKAGNVGLALQPGRGRHPKLTPAQAAEVLGWIDQSPLTWGFPTARWTAPRVAALIEQRWGVHLHPRYLNAWLAGRGISPQIPTRVARGRDEAAVQRWVRRTWPQIKKKCGSATPPWPLPMKAAICWRR